MDKISIGVQLSSWVHSLPTYYKTTKSYQISRQKPVPDHFLIKQWTKDLLLADFFFFFSSRMAFLRGTKVLYSSVFIVDNFETNSTLRYILQMMKNK